MSKEELGILTKILVLKWFRTNKSNKFETQRIHFEWNQFPSK